MLTSHHDFRLVSFGEDEVPPELYSEAERVFLESIGSTARTNTNEIAYWKDRYNREFSSFGDKLYIYGLLNNREVIGFALVFYFKSQRLTVIDHIAIKEPVRHFGSFFYFKNLIAQHLLEQGHQIDFAIAEIVTSTSGDPHPVEPQLLIQLLKQSGFKVAHIQYFTPSIREDEYQTTIESALMVHRNERGNEISAAKLMSLLNCLLSDLYLRWYAPHSLNLKGFRKQIETLRKFYGEQLSRNATVVLNGNWKQPHLPVPRVEHATTSLAANPVVQSVMLFVLTLGASVFLAGISYELGISILSVALVFGLSLFGLLTILAVWHKSAGQQADRVLKFLLSLLRRHKNIG